MNYTKLSRTVALALRHKPLLFELELDGEGWVRVESLLSALREERREWAELVEGDLHEMIARASKQRYDMRDGKIRALYGHSLKNRLAKEPGQPPEVLYHGTPQSAIPTIRSEGLKPMSRQYVHLSADRETAVEVGRRRDPDAALLVVRAGEAHRNGVTFYRGNEIVWLADHVPPQFITFPT